MAGCWTPSSITNTSGSAPRLTKVNVKQTENMKTMFYILGDPDTSPYAQTGVSVWDIRRLRTPGGLERLLVIHDIERLNPVICDLYTIADTSRWGLNNTMYLWTVASKSKVSSCVWIEMFVWSFNSLLQSPALHTEVLFFLSSFSVLSRNKEHKIW